MERRWVSKKEAIKLLGLPEVKPDLLEQLKILLAVEIEIYNIWKKEETEDYIYDECCNLFHELNRGQCVDIMEAITSAANQQSLCNLDNPSDSGPISFVDPARKLPEG